ncbi:hypothetical protein OVA03_14500 [Asticcacaulis sp. SL142]|uniref:hypothetical protein n=1 Tax=Asticcacaulis sp. SL142 TaxID=2995155 RepID=UPI00226D250F|nr:hypothetical protein [Asticcacaulis sp. SL142]WAC47898.1 hypothetical protein OVA03_14500 [Asticcacaulis sp. SL142]
MTLSPLKARDLQTPARCYSVSSTETAQGGRLKTRTLTGTIWGDFQPDVPAFVTGTDGRGYVVQAATFIVRTRAGMAPNDELHLKGAYWIIRSIDEGADQNFRLRIERTL